MLALNRVVVPNAQEVAGEVIDGEAIIINLATGIYYSMDGVGAEIWALIEAEQPLEEMVAAIVARFDVGRDRAEADVQRVVGQLLAEGLAVLSEREPAVQAKTQPQGGTLPYEPPELITYSDLGDLLALDPPAPGLKDIPWNAASEKPG
jgi:hypothetical protein